MNESAQLTLPDASAGEEPTGQTNAEMIAALARDPEIDVEKLRAVLAVRREWDADEARKSFARAMSDFQGECPIIEKGDDANGKAYARLDRIWGMIRPLMKKHGLTISWQACTLADGICSVAGMLTHRDGHLVELRYDAPLPELIRSQNKAQQMGSATTYAKRYCICSALNVVTGDEDDDGNAAGTKVVSAEEAETLGKLAGELDYLPNLLKFGDCSAVAEFPADLFDTALRTLNKLKRGRAAKKGGKA